LSDSSGDRQDANSQSFGVGFSVCQGFLDRHTVGQSIGLDALLVAAIEVREPSDQVGRGRQMSHLSAAWC
jgi:hypothetical protein